MKLLTVDRFVRYYSYFRLGFAKYLSYPLSIFQTLAVVYLYITDRLPTFTIHFTEFILISAPSILIIGILFGYYDMRKSNIYTVENVIVTESNPQAVHMNRLSMDCLEKLFIVHNMELPEEWHRLHRYWIKLDDNKKWRPPE